VPIKFPSAISLVQKIKYLKLQPRFSISRLEILLDFKDGAELILNPHLETELLQGKGEAYGIETLISKNTGRFTWSMNYTYSRAFRIISGPTSRRID
jgi:hypothetical protein